MRVLFRHLPLVLVAAMVAIGSAIELAGFGRFDWIPKLPLAALLTVAWARARGVGGAGGDR